MRHAVAQIVGGGPIVSAVSQPGGFSPGTADRLRTAEGRRAFVKAASPAQNEHTPGIHRTEARVVAGLPASPHLPRLLGTYDDGEWVAAVYADIEGAPPAIPWRVREIEATAAALTAIAECCTPNPVPGLRPEDVVGRYLAEVEPDRLTAALAGLSGYFVDAARNPPPRGLPTVRAFQAAHGVSTLRWLRRRLR
ncbi:hypothetical protein [Microlunatus ginsengisoli]|uniref:Phosphotransferase enzyme family protein n=1 Tax=Microlunatus ginsengisoli TaxID=363863 RepID=A0ABP6ZDW4_9ACTN